MMIEGHINTGGGTGCMEGYGGIEGFGGGNPSLPKPDGDGGTAT